MRHNEMTMAASRRHPGKGSDWRAKSAWEFHPAKVQLELAQFRKDFSDTNPVELASAVWYAQEIKLLIGQRYGSTL